MGLKAQSRLYLDKQLKVMNVQLETLAQTEKYRERVGLLTQIPGVGIYSAMTILIELQDVERFQIFYHGQRLLSLWLRELDFQYRSGCSGRSAARPAAEPEC
ncbi:IS110 family transposase [Sphingobacteriales bacterium CHB3]|nr:IS110 family transposase [Sphingobacteriales bacterium CHB3]